MFHLLILLLSLFPPKTNAIEPHARFTTYTTNDGLTDNSINALMQDAQGYIWIATENGLCRFDGYRFRRYKHDNNNPYSIPHNRVFALCIDKKKQLWVATSYGFARYNPERDNFHCVSLQENMKNIPNQYIRHLQCDDSGRLWFSTPAAFCYLNATQDAVQVISLPENQKQHKTPYIQSMSVAADGSVWLGVDNELWHYDNTSKQIRFVPQFVAKNDDEVILAITTTDNNGSLLFGTNQGRAYIFDGEKQNLSELKILPQFNRKGSNISAIYNNQNQSGYVYLLVKKIGLVNAFNDQTVNQNRFFSQIDNCDLSCMMFDKQGNCWLGHHKIGLSFAAKHQNFLHTSADPQQKHFLQSNVISALYADQQNQIWIGTDGGGLHLQSGANGEIHPFSIAGMSEDESVMWIGGNDKDGLLIGTFRNGVFHYDMRTKQVQHSSMQNDKLPSDDVRKVITDQSNISWILTHGKGITALTKFGFINYSTESEMAIKIAGNWTYDVVCLPNNALAVATNDGLSIISPDRSKTTNFRASAQSPSLANNNVYTLWCDGNNILWCGTQEGISFFNISEQKFVSQNILDDKSIASFAALNNDELWVATNNGLYKVSTHSHNVITSFTANDGLKYTSFSANASCIDSKKQLYFGGTFGFYQLLPNTIEQNKVKQQFIVTDILVNTKSVFDSSLKNDFRLGIDSVLELAYTQNNIDIQFSALNFIETQKNNFQYRLLGLDTSWSNSLQAAASFDNLPAGNYCFQLRTNNTSQCSATKALQLHIKILPPWWKRWWAYLLYFIIIAAILWAAYIYLYVSMRTRHQMQLEKARNKQIEDLYQAKIRFFTNISHDIRTPLTLIVSPINSLLANTSLDNESRQLLSVMKRNTAQLLQLVNELLEFRKIESGVAPLQLHATNLNTVIADVMHDFDNRAQQQNIALQLQAPQEIAYANIELRYFEKALYNLLANAFKFTPQNGSIRIILQKTEVKTERKLLFKSGEIKKQIEISIHDSGNGVPQHLLDKIFERFYEGENSTGNQSSGLGLSIVKTIVEQHGGSISCRNENGAVFTITLPQTENTDDNNQETSILAQQQTEAILPHSTPETSKAVTILLVEDNEELRNYVQHFLSKYYSIATASNGEEGFEMATNISPDFIISDVMMPLMDGYQLCAKLKQSLETSHIPVLLLTAKNLDEHQREGFLAGADDYIIKPFNEELLLLKISNMLKTRSQMRQRFSVETKDLSAITENSVDNRFMTAFMKEIEQHYSNAELSVESIGETIGLSRSHLYKKCLSLTGKTPVDILQEVRMQNAINLIKNTDLNISEVAYSVGYSDPRYFSNRFRKMTGMSPTEMREKR